MKETKIILEGVECVVEYMGVPAPNGSRNLWVAPKRKQWKVRRTLIEELTVTDWPMCKEIVETVTVENSHTRLDDGKVV